MNVPQPWETLREPALLSTTQKAITTLVLLVLGSYILAFFDAWPDTIKRVLYEIIIYLIPSPAIYALQSIMHRYSGAIDDASLFRRADFGNQRAKAEAIQRILGHAHLQKGLRKARSLSGLETLLPPSKELGPPGLGNWDNSCYQNSVLQGLASLPAFQQYNEKTVRRLARDQVSATTHRALQPFLHQLSDATARQTTIWTPSVLKSMDSWQQQDAQEYLSRILDSMEKEDLKLFQVLRKRSRAGLACTDRPAPFGQTPVDDQRLLTLPRRCSLSSEDRALLESLPRSPVDGMLAQALECQTCGFSEGYSLTPFNCLTLNLGLRGHSLLEDLLDEYTEPEMIDGVECTECTKQVADDQAQSEEATQEAPSPSKRPKLKPIHRTKAKQITLGRLPRDLIIHINRSIFDDYGNQRKNTAYVEFPKRLDVSSRWCTPIGMDDAAPQKSYVLRCAVTHYGRHDNGHYVAFGKRDKDWYCFNDEIVTRVSEREVLEKGNVFMLFYEAVDEVTLAQPIKVAVPEDQLAEESLHAQESPSEVHVESPPTSTGSEFSSSSDDQVIEARPGPALPVVRMASGTLHHRDEQGSPSRAPVVAAL
jgi:ubiquitin carboxyl-terminal hydrolase 1